MMRNVIFFYSLGADAGLGDTEDALSNGSILDAQNERLVVQQSFRGRRAREDNVSTARTCHRDEVRSFDSWICDLLAEHTNLKLFHTTVDITRARHFSCCFLRPYKKNAALRKCHGSTRLPSVLEGKAARMHLAVHAQLLRRMCAKNCSTRLQVPHVSSSHGCVEPRGITDIKSKLRGSFGKRLRLWAPHGKSLHG